MPLSFGAGIMPPANAGWCGPLLGEDTCGCGHPFAEHFVVDPFVTEWYFLHYHCQYCCREITGECCYLNAGLEFDEHDGSCLIENWPDSYRYVPPPEDSDNWGFNQERSGV
jgi:hypothetical protein